MKIPISWLSDYVNISLPINELADKLTLAGMEVEKIHYVGIPGGPDEKDRLVWDPELLVIGHLLKVEQHPNADKLVLATIEYGAEEPEVVVTGAPNLYQFIGQDDLAAQGLLAPLALEGATVYDGHKEGLVKTKLKGKALRGIFNRCMVCSAKELGLGEDHDGIMIFTAADLNRESLAPGTSLQEVFGDAIFEIDIIPNIARCASMVGVAREVAALTDQEIRYPDYNVVQEGEPIDGKVKISTENPELNPRFVAYLIEGVEQKPSPLWMQRRLEMAGQRPINVVVDISNYVMLEMGQPNHTFDYDYMRGRADQYDADGPVHIITRLAKEGETVTTLDGQERDMPEFTILVTDPNGNLSVGGIMGGANSEINDGTTNVLLEAAAWNYMNIRRSGHSLKLNSEAGFRFSRGVHPSQSLLGAKRAAELLRTLAGGTVAQGHVDYIAQPADPVVVEVELDYILRWSGLDVTAEECKTLLDKLEFETVVDGDKLTVTAPDHRIDIVGPQDIVEEVCRMYGYDNIPTTFLVEELPKQEANVEMEREMRMKDALVKLGLQEVITYRLTSPERERKMMSDGMVDETRYVELKNPIAVDRYVMRHNLLSSVVEIAAENSRHASRIALFELGSQYIYADDEAQLPDEVRRIAIVMTGERAAGHWQNGIAPAEMMDFYDLKGVVEGLLDDVHIRDLRVSVDSHPSFRPGRTARLKLGNKNLGWMGELHPLVVQNHDFSSQGGDNAVLAAILDVEVMLPLVVDAYQVEPIAVYPAVREDLAVLVDSTTSAADIEDVIRKSGGFLLKEVTLFDVYEGENIPEGQRSMAYHLAFQSPSKTLKDKDVKKLRNKIIGQLGRRLNAKLRE